MIHILHIYASMSYIRDMNQIILARVGQSLRNLRKQRGLSQLELARQAGTTRKAVINAEKGTAGLSLGTFIAMLEAMGAELTTLPVRRPTTEEIQALLASDAPRSPARKMSDRG